MHVSTRDRLEEFLAKRVRQTEVHQNASDQDAHLQSCPECSSELHEMQNQAEWMRDLRAPEELDPAPGFYARVLQRIEERAKRSIWYGLVYSPAGKRLAYVSLSLALALGFYVIAAEHTEQRPVLAQPAMAAAQSANPEVFGAAGAPAEQRDAVLVNLASYGNTATVSETNQP